MSEVCGFPLALVISPSVTAAAVPPPSSEGGKGLCLPSAVRGRQEFVQKTAAYEITGLILISNLSTLRGARHCYHSRQ